MKIKVNNFDLENILLSGQSFRVTKKDDFYYIILDDRVVKIKQENDYIIFYSNNENNLKNKIINYFDLNTNYTDIINNLNITNHFILNAIKKNINYRILNQNPFEMYISYIISQNNKVNRISTIVNNISKIYGKKIIYENKSYYLFPTFNTLKDLNLNDLSQFKLGFRDKYIIDALKKEKENNILEFISKNNTILSYNKLLSIYGIGPKVASCILLFGFHRFDTFPIDTWVKKFMEKNYNLKNISIKKIQNLLKREFKEYSGLVIQYFYNYERNLN